MLKEPTLAPKLLGSGAAVLKGLPAPVPKGLPMSKGSCTAWLEIQENQPKWS